MRCHTLPLQWQSLTWLEYLAISDTNPIHMYYAGWMCDVQDTATMATNEESHLSISALLSQRAVPLARDGCDWKMVFLSEIFIHYSTIFILYAQQCEGPGVLTMTIMPHYRYYVNMTGCIGERGLQTSLILVI